jgi:ribonuclease HI
MTKKKTTTATTTTTTTTTITTTKNRQTLDPSSIQGDTNLSVQLRTPRIIEDLLPPGKKLKLVGGSTGPTNLTVAATLPPMTAAAPVRRNNPFTDSSHDMSILLHFDGGSRGNPGVAGSGAHIVISRRVGLRQHEQDDNQADDDDDQNDDTNNAPGVRMATSTRTTTRRTVVVSRSTIRLQRFLQGSQTNNQAEYWGLITALECVYEQLAQQEPFLKEEKETKNHPKYHPKLPWTVSLTIQGDSKLVVQQMNGAWKVGDILQPAYQTAQECLHRIQALCRDTGVLLHYRLSHVYRNENKDADRTCETTI